MQCFRRRKMVTKRDRKVVAAATVVMVLFSFIAVMPFVILIASSLSSEASIAVYGYRFIPHEISFDAYRFILNQWGKIGRAYLITVLVTVIGTVLSLTVTSLFSYGVIQSKVRGTKVLFILLIISMLFNGGTVANYYIWTRVFHVRDTLFALILPGYLMSAFNVILVSTYFRSSIPAEMYEAAEIDGATQFTIFHKIVLPLSKPILATVGMLTAVSYWNDWTNGLYFIKDPNLYSIQQYLNVVQNNLQFLMQNADKLGTQMSMADMPATSARMAIAVLAILPMLIVFPFLQKYFVKGITIGAVKG